MRERGKKGGRRKEEDRWGGGGGGEGEERDGEEVGFLRVGRGKAKPPASSRGSPPSIPGRLTPRGVGDLKICLCSCSAPSRALGTRPNVPSACAACPVPARAAGAPPAPPRPCLRGAARAGGARGVRTRGAPPTCERQVTAASAGAERAPRASQRPPLCPPLACWLPPDRHQHGRRAPWGLGSLYGKAGVSHHR